MQVFNKLLDCWGRYTADLQTVQSILVGCNISQLFALAFKELLGAKVKIAKRGELHCFVVILQRWGVLSDHSHGLRSVADSRRAANENSTPVCGLPSSILRVHT